MNSELSIMEHVEQEFILKLKEHGLTPRLVSIIELTMKGHQTEAISDQINLTVKGVKERYTQIYKKLNVQNVKELLCYVFNLKMQIHGNILVGRYEKENDILKDGFQRIMATRNSVNEVYKVCFETTDKLNAVGQVTRDLSEVDFIVKTKKLREGYGPLNGPNLPAFELERESIDKPEDLKYE